MAAVKELKQKQISAISGTPNYKASPNVTMTMSKNKSNSHNDAVHLLPLTNVPTKY